jgi:hypothetical protein
MYRDHRLAIFKLKITIIAQEWASPQDTNETSLFVKDATGFGTTQPLESPWPNLLVQIKIYLPLAPFPQE